MLESEGLPVAGDGASARSAKKAADPEFTERAKRRKFTAEYKLDILGQAQACTKSGEIGALLRREGLYSSHLKKWRAQRDAGALSGLSPRKRGRRGADPLEAQNAALLQRAQRAEAELDKARRVIEVQGKVSALWRDCSPRMRRRQTGSYRDDRSSNHRY